MFKLFKYISISCLVLFYSPIVVTGEGFQASADILKNEQLVLGVLAGDPSVSLIDFSPYVYMRNNSSYNSDYFYCSYDVSVADIMLNIGSSPYPNMFLN